MNKRGYYITKVTYFLQSDYHHHTVHIKSSYVRFFFPKGESLLRSAAKVVTYSFDRCHFVFIDDTASVSEVTFLSAKDWKRILKGTLLAESHVIRALEESPQLTVHLSDALRLALVYRYGGWYADIDTVMMKPLEGIFKSASAPSGGGVRKMDKFYITSDGPPLFDSKTATPTDAEGNYFIGTTLANGFFGAMEPQSPFLWRSMEIFVRSFDNTGWATGGAVPMTWALMEACNITTRPKPKLTGLSARNSRTIEPGLGDK